MCQPPFTHPVLAAAESDYEVASSSSALQVYTPLVVMVLCAYICFYPSSVKMIKVMLNSVIILNDFSIADHFDRNRFTNKFVVLL